MSFLHVVSAKIKTVYYQKIYSIIRRVATQSLYSIDSDWQSQWQRIASKNPYSHERREHKKLIRVERQRIHKLFIFSNINLLQPFRIVTVKFWNVDRYNTRNGYSKFISLNMNNLQILCLSTLINFWCSRLSWLYGFLFIIRCHWDCQPLYRIWRLSCHSAVLQWRSENFTTYIQTYW